MRQWAHGAPNGTNDADQTLPEDDPLPEPGSPGSTSGEAAGNTTADTGPATAAHGAADFGIDLDWLPERQHMTTRALRIPLVTAWVHSGGRRE